MVYVSVGLGRGDCLKELLRATAKMRDVMQTDRSKKIIRTSYANRRKNDKNRLNGQNRQQINKKIHKLPKL